MRNIRKNPEPASLIQHRLTSHANYDNYPHKAQLRQALVHEQRGICCYCMAPIRPLPETMKIEHWHCQEQYPDEQLDYRNLLAACTGNAGQPYKNQHCDTHKGQHQLSRNPANPTHQVESLLHFKGDGTVSSNNLSLENELNKVLNLNLPRLKNQRKAVLDAFKQALAKGDTSPAVLRRWLSKWNGDDSLDDLKPYCQVVVYWLRKRLDRK